ncbi:Mis6-domain-containing protein [Dipodascopsis tothii]|uniref:Mis6-domain-containing protein n=1 Tax=Dipodascopsis tothii TaxID=44089 RepID=UPI0034CF0645
MDRRQRVDEALNGLLDGLETGITKSHSLDLISTLTTHVPSEGLTADALEKAVRVLTTPSRLRVSVLVQIIKVLLPTTRVTRQLVIRIVGSLGSGRGRVDMPVQVRLLRWLVCVYPMVDRAALESVYGILFSFLGFETLRPWICHLLFLTTSRRDVKPWRVQYVLDLQNRNQESKHLAGLLALYKEYYPDLVYTPFLRVSASLFKHPDPAFLALVTHLQQVAGKTVSAYPQREVSTKRRRLLPQAGGTESSSAVSTTDVVSLSVLARTIERIELPAQMGCALRGERMLYQVLVLRPSADAWVRLDTFLACALRDALAIDREAAQDQVRATSNADSALGVLLTQSLDLASYCRELMVSAQDFLAAEFLPNWDGIVYRNTVLKLVALAPPQAWDSLRGLIEPLVNLAFQKDAAGARSEINPAFCGALFSTVESLLRNWDSVPSEDARSSQIAPTAATMLNLLATSGVAAAGVRSTAAVYVLGLYRFLATARLHTTFAMIHLPPPGVITSAIFSLDPVLLSLVCAVIARYKPIFTSHPASSRNVSVYNGYVMDTCNLLWRHRAFNSSDKGSTGYGIDAGLIDRIRREITTGYTDMSIMVNFNAMFGITEGALFAPIALETLRAIERTAMGLERIHSGPITSTSLNENAKAGGVQLTFADFRLRLLEELKKHGYGGVCELLYASMTSLLGKTAAAGSRS